MVTVVEKAKQIGLYLPDSAHPRMEKLIKRYSIYFMLDYINILVWSTNKKDILGYKQLDLKTFLSL